MSEHNPSPNENLNPQFIHLRSFSVYSLSQGAIHIDDLLNKCAEDKMPAVAITDKNNLFGALEFASKAKKANIQPIIGATVKVRFDLDESGPELTGELVLLVQSERGYLNLLSLISASYLETKAEIAPLLTLSQIAQHSEGLILLSGGMEGLVTALMKSGVKDRLALFESWVQNHFKDRFYLEIERHGLASEKEFEPLLLAYAASKKLPLVATNSCYFPKKDLHGPHDAFLCIAQGAYISQDKRKRVTDQHYIKSVDEMCALFADLPSALQNSVYIAQRCHFLLTGKDPILPAFPTSANLTETDELKRLAHLGLEERFEIIELAPGFSKQDYRDRLDYELGVIEQMKFPGYFLIVADFIHWAKSQNIPVGPGRGSGAGSVAAWSLSITDLDPLRFGLLFERFLNPERVSMPDFDIDFCQERRDEVIQYVQQRYGKDRVAQIITFGKLQARAVLRDVGRVLEIPYGQVDKICKLVPNNPANPITLKEAVETDQQIRDEMRREEKVRELVETALPLEGLYRHASTHAAGLVIGDRPLSELVPLYRDPRSDMPVTQFSMKYVEQAGLVKFDFLGLKTLTVITHVINQLSQKGITIDLKRLKLDDAKTYEMLSKGDAIGVFQFESAGMRDALKKLRPTQFEELIALGALYRPGPMDNIPKFIRVKNGEEPADYLHPSLEGLLKETFGIIVYQEQVIQIAQILSGYSLGKADLLRRAMGKKIKEEMEAQRAEFVDGAVRNNVDRGQAGQIFDQVDKFAGYGFNKSHAAAYALVAYQTAYLKANYPHEFMAGLMTLDLGNTDKLNVFGQELKHLKITLLPPDIQTSEVQFTVENSPNQTKSLRYALAAIKGVGQAAMENLVSERKANGPYKNIYDLLNRLDMKSLNKRQLENLIAAGAMDCFGLKRAVLHQNVENFIKFAQSAQRSKQSGQVGLFGEDDIAPPSLNEGIFWDKLTELRYEFEALGFYLSSHPLESYGQILKRIKIQKYADIVQGARKSSSSRFKIAGVLLTLKEKVSKKGSRFAFAQFSDETGIFESVIFSEILLEKRKILKEGSSFILSVDATYQEEGPPRLTCVSLDLIEEKIDELTHAFHLTIKTEKAVSELKKLLTASASADSSVRSDPSSSYSPGLFYFNLPISEDETVEMEVRSPLRLTQKLKAEIEKIPGIEQVEEV